MTDEDAGKAAAALLAGNRDDPALQVRVPADGNHFRRAVTGHIVAVGWPPNNEYLQVAVDGDVLPFAPDELLVPGRNPNTTRGRRP